MKKIILSILTLIVCSISFGQNANKKLPSLGVHMFFNDFQTAADIRSSGLSNVMRDKQWSRSKRMIPGLAISYVQGISDKFDFVAMVSGAFGEYPLSNKSTLTTEQSGQKLILEAVATGNLKLLNDNFYINPFITAGIGASKYKGYFNAFIPLGVGMQIKLVDNIFLTANSQYRIAVTENGVYHFFHSFGVVAPIKKKA